MQDKSGLRTQRLAMISQWVESGLSQKAFCAKKRIAYHVFHYWYKIYRSAEFQEGSFLPVKVVAEPGTETITVKGTNGIELQIPVTEPGIHLLKRLLTY
jgi:hypothetical protein